jgi:trigger factor
MKKIIAFLLGFLSIPGAAWSNDMVSAQGDEIFIHYHGSVDEGQFDEGDMNVVIGSKMTVPGFEDALIGLKEGDEKTFQVTFPEVYPTVQIDGKDVSLSSRLATFKVKVQKIVRK